VPDSVWETVGTSRLDWRASSSERQGQAGFSPVDGGPAAGKRQSHGQSQGPRGRAGFSLGDGGHIADRLEAQANGRGRPVDGGPAAGKRQSHGQSQGPRGRAGLSLGDGGHIADRLEDKLKRTAGAGRVQSSGRWACSRRQPGSVRVTI
jgi:hypothetical protein